MRMEAQSPGAHVHKEHEHGKHEPHGHEEHPNEGHAHGEHAHEEHGHEEHAHETRPAQEHNEHEHLFRLEGYGFAYRCTFCKHPIPWTLAPETLGMGPGEEPVMGKMYRYGGCYCGFGRFVTCERTYMDPKEMEAHLAEHMAH
jgi:hypothetical protein